MNKQNVSWKLVPVEPTEEMLKAMDECSTEGYDERLYAGHAASVYMAAVDVAPASPQQCYCGDITRLGVVHRADSFCDEKPEQEPVVFLKEWSDWRDMVVVNIMRHGSIDKHLARELANHFQSMTPQPKEPEQKAQCTNKDSWNCKYCRKIETCEAINDPRNFGKPKEPEQEPVAWADHGVVNWIADKQFKHAALLYEAPQRTWVELSDEEIEARAINFYNPEMYKRAVLWAQEKLKERNQ